MTRRNKVIASFGAAVIGAWGVAMMVADLQDRLGHSVVNGLLYLGGFSIVGVCWMFRSKDKL